MISDLYGVTETIKSDCYKLNRFIIKVGRIHIGCKELTGSSMDYRKAGLVLIEQGISDTLCSLDPDLITSDILDQVEVFFHYLDRHVIDDIGFMHFQSDAVQDEAVNVPAEILDQLNDLLLAADTQAHRLQGANGHYA
jgi:hypothetical protein